MSMEQKGTVERSLVSQTEQRADQSTFGSLVAMDVISPALTSSLVGLAII